MWQLGHTSFEVNYKKKADGNGRFTILFGWELSRIVWKIGGADVI